LFGTPPCHQLPRSVSFCRDWADFGGIHDNENADADFANFGESPTAASSNQSAFFNAGEDKEEKAEVQESVEETGDGEKARRDTPAFAADFAAFGGDAEQKS
jgi:hypothetical protein